MSLPPTAQVAVSLGSYGCPSRGTSKWLIHVDSSSGALIPRFAGTVANAGIHLSLGVVPSLFGLGTDTQILSRKKSYVKSDSSASQESFTFAQGIENACSAPPLTGSIAKTAASVPLRFPIGRPEPALASIAPRSPFVN